MDPSQNCPNQMFTYKINFWCLGHGRYIANSAEALSIVFAVSNFIVLCSAIYLLRFSKKAIKRLIEPSTQDV